MEKIAQEKLDAVLEFMAGPGEADVVAAWKETHANRRSFAQAIVEEAKNDWDLDLDRAAVIAVLDDLAYGEPYVGTGYGDPVRG